MFYADCESLLKLKILYVNCINAEAVALLGKVHFVVNR